MKRELIPFILFIVFGLTLTVATPQASSQPQPSPTASVTAAPASTQTPWPTTVVESVPTSAHTSTPGEPPAKKGRSAGDQSTIASTSKSRMAWALLGDHFTLGIFERPYPANNMKLYLPFLDIVSGYYRQDPMWNYVQIRLVGPMANDGFPARYAVEVDADRDGAGEWLVMADHPYTRDWTTQGVRIFEDQNGDVGGKKVIRSDSEGKGDGYEYVSFDQGQGRDPDAAWTRLSPTDPKSIEIAFKASLLPDNHGYLASVWAGTSSLDPALFDLDDHFTFEEAGSANPEFDYYYPIKGLPEIDNTCRQAIGFNPTGDEPGLCPQGR